MRTILRSLSTGLLALPLAALLGLLLAAALTLQTRPLVTEPAPVSVDDIARGHALLMRHDPRQARPGVVRAAMLSQRDVEWLLNQAGKRYGEPRAAVSFQAGSARLRASLPLAMLPWDAWINLELQLRADGPVPQVTALRIGHLPMPPQLAQRALPLLLEALGLQAQGALARRMVTRVDFLPQRMVMVYAWRDDPRQALGNSLLPPDAQARLKVYVDALAARLATLPAAGGQVSMAELMPPLFALARQRSADDDAAARENRSALLALALVANRGALNALVPASRQWTPVRPAQLTLRGRSDFPLHFLVSAVIAAERGGPLSDAIGVYKEVSDAHGGSGFSFNDIAADRAGTRLGLRAVRTPRALQQRLADGILEADLMPPVDDLPEFLPAAEFARRFGGVGAPAYRVMMAAIENRLDQLPLLAGSATMP